jgi:hypothetical protein
VIRRYLTVLLALALGLAPAVSRGDDPPGQSVELDAGAPAPFKGNLSDATRWAYVKSLRDRAEKERDAAVLEKADARARQSDAEAELAAVKASKPPNWGVLIGVTGAALVVGIALGVIGVVVVQDKAK